VIAIDTNVLVHAHREDSPWHHAATVALASLGNRRWAIPWPCVHEFLAVTTHPRIFDPPSPLADAVAAIASWFDSKKVERLAESEGYWEVLAGLLQTAKIVGPQVHDARIASLCIAHGIEELWSADRDFSRFTGLRVRNPLVDPR
jgi:uncharacterized protein